MNEILDAEQFIEEMSEGAAPDNFAQRMESVQAFAEIIKEKRKSAIDGRRASGIERIWQEDDDHYEGCDKFNGRYGLAKPRTTEGAFVQDRKKPVGRSTAFANITRPYCDAGAARVADMLLPTDYRNWALRNTIVPSLVGMKGSQIPAIGADGQPVMQPIQPQDAAQQPPQQAPGMMSRIGSAISGMLGGQVAQPQGQPQQPQMRQTTVGEIAMEEIDKAKASAERAQTHIDDWLVECHYHAEVRKVIECAARLGVGILKGPHPMKRKARAATNGPEGWKLQIDEKTAPTSIYVSPWNFYPDENCGEDIQRGAHCFERDDITARGLIDLKDTKDSEGRPVYIDEMIDLCIEEGPISSIDGIKKLRDSERTSEKDLFEIWYFHGHVSKNDMEAAGCECDDGAPEMQPCIVTMVNDHIIKISLSPLDSGEFPYDVMVWQNKIGHWAGIGIARQMRTCQKALNGAVRAMMDNLAMSSGPQIIIDRSKIEPADGKWYITPNKIWWKKVDGENMDDVRQAFMIVTIETRQVEILNAIQYWTKAAEDVTGLPMLIQGQQGKAPDTVGGMAMLNNNATSVLRRIARTFDDRLTEPHIGRYYEWLLLHGPSEAKGDFQIEARGSSALVERDIQNQAMMQLLGQAPNPAYGLDPEKVMKEVLKGMRLDPKSFTLDDEQKQARANQPPPEDPRVTAAKIMIGARSQDLDKKLAADAAEGDKDRQLTQWTKTIDAQLESANLTAEERQNLENAKVTLSGLVMKLNTQKELSNVGHSADLYKHRNPSPQVVTPPTEPAGRAAPGQAFQQ